MHNQSRVLITGAGGFIGRRVIQLLSQQNVEVHGTSRSEQRDSQCIWHQIQLLELSQIRPLLYKVCPTHLLHLAWDTTPGEYWNGKENYAWVQSSLELMRAFHEVGGKRIVVAGSCGEYQWDNRILIEDDSRLSYENPYAVCKNSLRQLMKSYCGMAGMGFAWGRLFYLYGPGEYKERLVPSIILPLLANQKAYCLSGENILDYLYVDDAAEALISLLGREVEGTFNIASGVPLRVKDLVRKIGVEMGKEEQIHFGEKPLSEKEPLHVIGNIARLTQAVGWSPEYSLEKGIKETIKWWQGDRKGR